MKSSLIKQIIFILIGITISVIVISVISLLDSPVPKQELPRGGFKTAKGKYIV